MDTIKKATQVLAQTYGPWFGGPEQKPTPGAQRSAERAAWALADAGLLAQEVGRR